MFSIYASWPAVLDICGEKPQINLDIAFAFIKRNVEESRYKKKVHERNWLFGRTWIGIFISACPVLVEISSLWQTSSITVNTAIYYSAQCMLKCKYGAHYLTRMGFTEGLLSVSLY